MRLEHHLVGGYVRYISPHIIIIIITSKNAIITKFQQTSTTFITDIKSLMYHFQQTSMDHFA